MSEILVHYHSWTAADSSTEDRIENSPEMDINTNINKFLSLSIDARSAPELAVCNGSSADGRTLTRLPGAGRLTKPSSVKALVPDGRSAHSETVKSYLFTRSGWKEPAQRYGAAVHTYLSHSIVFLLPTENDQCALKKGWF